MNTENRSSFSGKLGFVLAAAGSAVGLGNLWRFPYLAARYGGGIFLLVYLILAVTFGFALMVSEIAIGRKTGLSAIGAYGNLSKKFAFVGYLTAIVPMIIFPYYSVIGGWVMKYLFAFTFGDIASTAGDSFFTTFISSNSEPIVYFMLFILITSVVVFLGVEKGIEASSKFMMPLLVLLSVIIAVYVVTLPGAKEGVIYYLKPDFSKFSPKTVLAAMGQLFYSMSLAMGIMVTYGSYMKKKVNLESSVAQIEIFDTLIAFVAGLMIVPAVFIFSGGDESMLNAGPQLMFVTLPKVFASLNYGTFIGILFFVLVLFAALTSSISLMETVVSIFQDKFKWSRKFSCIVVGIGAILVGLPSSLGFGPWSDITPLGMSILDFWDFLSNSIVMPIVAFLTCIFVAYVIKTKTVIDEVKISSKFKREKLFVIVIKYFAPICILAILISSVLQGMGLLVI